MATDAEAISADDLNLLGDEAPADDTGGDAKGGAKPDGGVAPKTVETSPSSPFGEKWRDDILAGLPDPEKPKAQNWLKTRSSPYEILRAGMSADARISEIRASHVKVPTGKDDDPKDVAAYRKAKGVPEAADKYKFDIPQDFGQLSETDEALKKSFLEKAHANHWSQSEVDFALQTHIAIIKETKAAEAAQTLRAQQAAVDELHVHFGKEYRPTVELINRMMATELSEAGMTDAEERRSFLSKRFPDGTALGEHPAFVKMMAKIAKERADDGALDMGETDDGVDLDTKIDQMIDVRNTDPKQYERMQPELQRLIARQNRMKGR